MMKSHLDKFHLVRPVSGGAGSMPVRVICTAVPGCGAGPGFGAYLRLVEQRTIRPPTRSDRASAALAIVFGAVVTSLGVATLAGIITFAGWGEGTLASRLICGGVYTVIGLGIVGGGAVGLFEKDVMVLPPPKPLAPDDPAAEPANQVGLGNYSPARSDRPLDPNSEF
jgi:hypothetical protein